MKYYEIALFFLIALSAKAQQLIIKDGLKAQYVQEAILPVSNNAYVVLKDSTAYLYNVANILPYKTQQLKDSYVLNVIENRLYKIRLLPQYFDQIDADTQELITLVTYTYETHYSVLGSSKTKAFSEKYGYLIPKNAVSEDLPFNESFNIEDNYTAAIYDDSHFMLPSNYIRADKTNIIAVHRNGDLVLTAAENHKVTKKKIWSQFNGSLSLVNCVKIGDVARITFQIDPSETDQIEAFWSIINLKTQAFVPIDLKKFNANLANLQEQDAVLLNSVPFFYKGTNNSNIRMFVLPNKNFVWLDDESYYYGSDELNNYATMQKEDKSFSLNAHGYIYNHPSRILSAIAPQEKDRIRAIAKIYVKNKYKIELERCNK
ncbi:hypothetical protein [Lacinutrix sp. Hel_I_90]|uniref:hypothetical protein n=1 Tax=Lacinutrix sp. Hel_I_90 TaxID=1249999 RepID=UPI0005C8319E|nr:hypothetical protein [Lacinutrix sp. Hel_I_90]